MWLVIKYKKNQLEVLKKSVTSIIGDKPEFYIPKIKINKIFKGKIVENKKDLLNKYIFCRHQKFKEFSLLNLLNYAKGIQLVLKGLLENQKNIIEFINICRSHENEDGFIKQSFFNNLNKSQIQFQSGPFSKEIFQVIEEKSKEIKILKNNIKIKISKEQPNVLFNYV